MVADSEAEIAQVCLSFQDLAEATSAGGSRLVSLNDLNTSRYCPRFLKEAWTLKPLAVNKNINLGNISS